MKRITIGVMAHVDSGKTTLCEALLYHGGEIRALGRVDRQNAFLDTHSIERSRGITIFSKQARVRYNGSELTFADTPGHVDFSAETERILKIIDCAILIISAPDGIQSHTETLLRLLEEYCIPVFIFVNKTDLTDKSHSEIIAELKKKLGDGCVDFGGDFFEDAAMCSETLMERFLETGTLCEREIQEAIGTRRLFPCYFGSALKLSGTKEFLDGLLRYAPEKAAPAEFGARVFKTIVDDSGTKLTFMRITGGSLKVRAPLSYHNGAEAEKVAQLRIYSGEHFEAVPEVFPGQVCAAVGLTNARPGTGYGFEDDDFSVQLSPVLSYRVIFPDSTDPHSVLNHFKQLEAEDPELHVEWDERLSQIHVRIMGEVQLEVLTQLVREQFGLEISFDSGKILYKETIACPSEGVGHYEPLKHYAEVHLLLEPTERGSGLEFCTDLSEDVLDRNWQRLILTHMSEKTHLGVLTGSPITDMRITLIAGRAHQKHTEGGDFRQATYRAIRHGLRCAESILLEPVYAFKLHLPSEYVGRAMTDISSMGGEFSSPEVDGEFSTISGLAPVSTMQNYHRTLTAYTRGRGRLFCTLHGYRPCHNVDEVIKSIAYDCDSDSENPASSIFCSHGAGFLVKWDEVRNYMHIQTDILSNQNTNEDSSFVKSYIESIADDNELMRIFERTYGPVKREALREATVRRAPTKKTASFKAKPYPAGPEYLLVDGYNIIFAWDELKELSKGSLESARARLIDILTDYRGVRQCELIVVFDAYRVKNNPGSIEKIHNIHVVYTKEAETADMYIEKATHVLGKKHRVRVATSDLTEQIIILGGGALRISAADFISEVEQVRREIRDFIAQTPSI